MDIFKYRSYVAVTKTCCTLNSRCKYILKTYLRQTRSQIFSCGRLAMQT